MKLMSYSRGSAVVIAGLILTGCYTVPETGRKSLALLPESQTMQLGLTEFQKLKSEVPISRNAAANAMLQRVGKRIAAVAPMPDAQWEFVVFESEEANAFCLPGGKVGVYTGILPITKDEAGLATVIGHEVAHAVARHGTARISRGLLSDVLGTAVAVGADQSKYATLIKGAYGLGSQVAVELPYSRLEESEADHLGLLYMARAGYDPRAAVAFWQRFAEYNKSSGSSVPWFLRTHPLDSTRIEQLEKLMPEALAEYQKAAR